MIAQIGPKGLVTFENQCRAQNEAQKAKRPGIQGLANPQINNRELMKLISGIKCRN